MSLNALAVFVRTPGLSPVKTLLAEEIGEERAEKFYRLCIESLRKTTQSMMDVHTYWAVAEEAALEHEFWSGYNCIWPGGREYGKAQHHIYESLRAKHEKVVLTGVYCPQITSYMIYNAFSLLEDFSYVVGPANRGNYYLFGGCEDMKLKSWANARYDKDYKMQHLVANLPSQPFMFGERDEVQTSHDMVSMIRQMPLIMHRSQRAVVDFAQDIVREG